MTQLVSLYDLLPAIYRIRDTEQGEPLRALLAVIESELRIIEEDIAGLYDNMFIETCDEWVVPYIGDLLRVRGLHAAKPGGFSQRAYVANTLMYRRRKGTAAVLEQLTRDTTGWPTRVVEFFQRLITTQHMNHIRPHNHATIDLRDAKALELVGGPFEQTQHTADVHHIGTGRGRYNIPNIGLFVWRLQPYPVERATSRAVVEPPDGRFRFSPIGVDTPLFNRPRSELEITHLAGESNVPGPLRRRVLYDDLEALRQALVDGQTSPQSPFLSVDNPAFQVFVGNAAGELTAIPAEEILICDLRDIDIPGETDWRRPPTSKTYTSRTRFDHSVDPPVPLKEERPIQVAVDPVLGRLGFPAGVVPERVAVSYAYGFSGDIGSGPYDRSAAVAVVHEELGRPITWQAAVGQTFEAVAGEPIFATLEAAVTAWNAQPAGTVGVIVITDSAMYEENLTGANVIQIPAASVLVMVAADWPLLHIPDSPEQQRFVGIRPHIRGNISIRGTATSDPGTLVLNGLLIEGTLRCLAGNLGHLWLDHCTIVPGAGELRVDTANNSLNIRIERSICGPIFLLSSLLLLQVCDSIVGNGAQSTSNEPAITAAGTAVTLQQTTVFGTIAVRSLEAENAIFTGLVDVERTQIGCVRFSFVPNGSRTPQRYRCQPDLALEESLAAEERQLILASLNPAFTSLEYGQPGYGQLALMCPTEIRTGAEDSSEMGVFSHLQQPQRLANLRVALEEYLRFGLEAGIIFVT